MAPMEKSKPRRRNVTPENIAEAQRLKSIWDQTKEERRARGVHSQEAFGLEFGIGNQAAVGFFLNGTVPLSLKAAKGFAKGLRVDIDAFSPRLADQIQQLAAGITPPKVSLIAAEPTQTVWRASVTVAEALERIGIEIALVPPDSREALATNLAGWARAGGHEPWHGLVLALLTPAASLAKRHGT